MWGLSGGFDRLLIMWVHLTRRRYEYQVFYEKFTGNGPGIV